MWAQETDPEEERRVEAFEERAEEGNAREGEPSWVGEKACLLGGEGRVAWVARGEV